MIPDHANPAKLPGFISSPKCAARSAISAEEPLSPWRFRLNLVDGDGATTTRSRKEGAAFQAIREACVLTVHEVAAGWNVPAAEIRGLELGLRSFTTVFDLQAAISQLWCWRSERGMHG